MTDAEEFNALTEILAKSIREGKQLSERFKVAPRTKPYKRFALIVLYELLRKGESVETMARAGAHSGINVITRAAFENYADIVNIFKYKDTYPDYMTWMSFNQLRSFLQPIATNSTRKTTESFVAGAKASFGKTPAEILETTCRELATIAEKLPSKYKTSKGKVIDREMFRFTLADKIEEYDFLYRHLSAGVHGRLSAMLDGILHGEELQWPPTDPVTRPLVAIDSLCALLLESCSRVSKHFGKPDAPIKRLAKEHAANRARYNRD